MKQELVRNASQTIGVTSSVVSEQCYQQRSAIIITNTSTGGQTVYISLSQEAVVGQSIPLKPGGVYSDTMDGGYKPSNLQINAISDIAGATIAIQERIIMNTY